MILPFISSVTRDVFETVPPVLKEAAYGLGCTTWEVVRRVVIPHTRAGVIGAIMLALGRALGETMAVTFVIGNAHKIAASILAPGTTISATIANEFTEATGDIYTSSLIALGLILFVVTFIVLAAARFMLHRMKSRGGNAMANTSSALPVRRRARSKLFMGLSIGSALLGLLMLAIILGTLIYKGVAGLNLAVFTEMTPPPGESGGLLNAIYGSVVMTLIGVVIGTPISILAGTYLAEYGRFRRLAHVVRFINDILLSAPSIVIGLFVYENPCDNPGTLLGHRRRPRPGDPRDPDRGPHHGGHAAPGTGYPPRSGGLDRHAALAHDHLDRLSGRHDRHHHRRAAGFPPASPARPRPCSSPTSTTSSGARTLNAPMANLPVVIFQFALSPYEDWQQLAWTGALLITLSVLTLSIFARMLTAKKAK